MAKTKRPHEAEAGASMDEVHPSRKKRVKYNAEDVELAKIYSHLADEVQDVRIKAAGDLIKNVSTDLSDRMERQEVAETRLIKGLTSGRKAARLGFSIALAELIRLKARSERDSSSSIDLKKIVQLTTPQGNVSGQERRDYLLGRRFAFQAVLQSDIGLDKDYSNEEWSKFVEAIFELAAEKPWLRRDCGSMLHEYLVSHTSDLKKSRVQAIVDEMIKATFLKTPEGVGLWIVIQRDYSKVKLPNGTWNHNNPLSSQERQILTKVLLEDAIGDENVPKKSGSRQSSTSFVWTVILQELLSQDDQKKFQKFWETCVASPMFSSKSSPERRSLGLQIVSYALALSPPTELQSVLHPSVIRCIVDQRSQPDRYLHKAAKNPLNQMVALAKRYPETASVIVIELVLRGAANFDQVTKTKTIESIVSEATDQTLKSITRAVLDDIEKTHGKLKSAAESHQRSLADLILAIVRTHKSSRVTLPYDVFNVNEQVWLFDTLRRLSDLAYRGSPGASTRNVTRSRLMSSLNHLMDSPVEHAAKAPTLTVWYALRDVEILELSEDAKVCLGDATSCIKQIYGKGAGHSPMFSLLIALGAMEVLNAEPDAITVLQDIIVCYRTKDISTESTTMLIELLLSFISKPSKVFRKLAERVFTSLTSNMTAESLQSLTDILDQKENLSGQRTLFQAHDDNHPNREEDVAIDVDEMSDVEMVNGQIESGDDESDYSSSDEQSEAEAGGIIGGEEDEEAAFDRKLADALGTAAVDDDSDDDGTDMDDDEMIALEPHLESIFKERQQQMSKKQEKKDAKENIVNFKNRVLDLLMIYVKAECGSILAIDTLLPLLRLLRMTTSKPTAEKALAVLKQYFDSCTKKKSLPQLDSHEACFDVLAAVHGEIKLGGSKLHATACSRASLFLAKTLYALDLSYHDRITAMYVDLLRDWYIHAAHTKVQGSIFSEWMNWLQSTRKTT